MGKGRPKRYTGPRPINLLNQAGILRTRYPQGKVVTTRDRLTWLGELIPTAYSDTYEVVVDHNTRQQPLVYVTKPELHLVDGLRLPHVFPFNTLCLHTEHREEIASQRLADTVVPWASEWLFFYELWLASGGEWKGGGIHPTGGGGTVSDSERADHRREKQERLKRLTTALMRVHGADCDTKELLHNARL